MKFSVIIPIYNCEDSLPGCIESIMNQTYPHWELILVDDGSTDGSLALCEAYSGKDGRIQVIHQENAGQGPARNNGMKAASGDYIVFCDADDFYECNALEIFASAAEKENMPEMIIGGYREFCFTGDSSVKYGRRIAEARAYLNNQNNIRHAYISLIKNGLITSPWAKAYCRQLMVEKNVFFPGLRRCEDIVFNLANYNNIQSLSIVNEMVYNYQTPHGDIYTRKFPINMFDIDKFVYQQMHQYLKQWEVDDEASVRYCNSLYLKDISVLLRLNYLNQWNLSSNKRRELSRRMLYDPDTVNACATTPDGTMNKIIRLVVRSRSESLANLFSIATVLYQKIRGTG